MELDTSGLADKRRQIRLNVENSPLLRSLDKRKTIAQLSNCHQALLEPSPLQYRTTIDAEDEVNLSQTH